jgi:mannose-6-phosphate isomerase-like protein (cupin superfamily)
MRSTVSGSSGVMVGRTWRPVSITSARFFLRRPPSRFHQCTKSPEPHKRHFQTPSGQRRSTDRIVVYRGSSWCPKGSSGRFREFADAEAEAELDPLAKVKVIDVIGRQALAEDESPFGAVGVVHSGADLDAWWIWKDEEDVEPTLAVIDREDLLYVIRGSLRLEFEGGESHVLGPGSAYVIPAGRPFRGYRWPRDGDPCLFLAVAPAGASFTRL